MCERDQWSEYLPHRTPIITSPPLSRIKTTSKAPKGEIDDGPHVSFLMQGLLTIDLTKQKGGAGNYQDLTRNRDDSIRGDGDRFDKGSGKIIFLYGQKYFIKI